MLTRVRHDQVWHCIRIQATQIPPQWSNPCCQNRRATATVDSKMSLRWLNPCFQLRRAKATNATWRPMAAWSCSWNCARDAGTKHRNVVQHAKVGIVGREGHDLKSKCMKLHKHNATEQLQWEQFWQRDKGKPAVLFLCRHCLQNRLKHSSLSNPLFPTKTH